MGRLHRIIVDMEGGSTLANLELIEIIDNNNPYPALLGIDWATDMNAVINIKKWKMIFVKKSLCIIIPLNLAEG